ncbi:MAG: hypothetical protein VB835_11790 [Pirellulales bacterium]
MSSDPVNIDFDPNDYERPNQKWRCGGQDAGAPCPLGPDRSGHCGAVCTPEKVDDQYFCNNTSVMNGRCDHGPLEDGSCCYSPAQCTPLKRGSGYICNRGACEAGPLPDGSCCQSFARCRPFRTVLARRRIFSVGAFAAALGIAWLLAGSPARKTFINPGQVSTTHGGIAERCQQCHDLGDNHLGDWVTVALGGQSAVAQNRLCVECHDDIGSQPNAAHGCTASALGGITERLHSGERDDSGSLMLRISRASFATADQLACATCHQEHRGGNFDLQQMADSRCQSCHAAAFDSFAHGHPEFSDYPYRRRTRIYFDHESHYGVHFRDVERLPAEPGVEAFVVKGKAPQQTCILCHEMDLGGEKMLVRPFGESCAACHAGQIKDDLLPGLSLFALPVLDSDVFDVRKLKRGPKNPEAAGILPPLMRLLFSDSNEFSDLDGAARKLDLSDLRDATPGQLVFAINYFNALKQELKQIKAGGQIEIERRLAASLGPDADENDVRRLSGLIRHDWIMLALGSFQQLLGGQTASEEDNRPNGPIKDDDELIAVPTAVAGKSGAIGRGWYVRGRDLSLRYRPTGHADEWLTAVLDVAVRGGGSAAENSPLRELYQRLSLSTATGRCMKCHTIDATVDGTYQVNWHPYRPQRGQRHFTRFAHQPHLTMLDDQGCMACHKLNSPDASVESDVDWNVLRSEFFHGDWRPRPAADSFRPNFQTVMKSDCTQCHRPQRVSQNCTTCHNYHVNAHD